MGYYGRTTNFWNASMSASFPITVVIADDHTIVRRGLVSLLSLAEGITVVGEAENGREALEVALRLRPDVVLMDVSMPQLNGLDATEQLKKRDPGIKVLILSAHDNDEYVRRVVRSGANGYLLKSTTHEELFAAIRTVAAGDAFFSPGVSKVAVDKHARDESAKPEGDRESTESRLTPREREILQMVAEGRTHQQVATLLSISVRTVDTHCNNIMQKLDIHDAAGLATYAIKNRIVILP